MIYGGVLYYQGLTHLTGLEMRPISSGRHNVLHYKRHGIVYSVLLAIIAASMQMNERINLLTASLPS